MAFVTKRKSTVPGGNQWFQEQFHRSISYRPPLLPLAGPRPETVKAAGASAAAVPAGQRAASPSPSGACLPTRTGSWNRQPQHRDFSSYLPQQRLGQCRRELNLRDQGCRSAGKSRPVLRAPPPSKPKPRRAYQLPVNSPGLLPVTSLSVGTPLTSCRPSSAARGSAMDASRALFQVTGRNTGRTSRRFPHPPRTAIRRVWRVPWSRWCRLKPETR